MKENTFESNNDNFMQMSPWDFDQDEQNGWRKLQKTKEYLKAVEAVRDYTANNLEKIFNQPDGSKKIHLEMLNFHAGQLLAQAGESYYGEAVKAFNTSSREDWIAWNSFLSANVGFLENNIDKVENALMEIKFTEGQHKMDNDVSIVQNFKRALEAGERNYENAWYGHIK